MDDAYYGMLFDDACEKESLFGRLARASNNLLAVKIDGATKEEFVWGLRVGFITFGVKNGTAAVYKALEDKTAGLIRAYVSNISNPGQSVVLKALNDPEFRAQQAEKVGVLRARAAVVAKECRKPEYADCWDVYPFNSGYFMCLRLKDADADAVRVRLLDDHGVGTIALGKREVRVAFSCLAESQNPRGVQRGREGGPLGAREVTGRPARAPARRERAGGPAGASPGRSAFGAARLARRARGSRPRRVLAGTPEARGSGDR